MKGCLEIGTSPKGNVFDRYPQGFALAGYSCAVLWRSIINVLRTSVTIPGLAEINLPYSTQHTIRGLTEPSLPSYI